MKQFLYVIIFTSAIYLIFSCSKTEVAPAPVCNVFCANSGVKTESCGCNCPKGWEGKYCNTASLPIIITIDSVFVTNFPTATPTGGSWDATAVGNFRLPDIYILVLDETGTKVLGKSTVTYNDADNTRTYGFAISPNVPITDLKTKILIRLMDEDINGAENMSGIVGTIYEIGNPRYLPFNCSNCTSAFKLGLKYTF
jgi:hypothetical protein